MTEITPVIIEEGLIKTNSIKERKTVRAIILNKSNEILMIYSKAFRDYTFAGGGIKSHEDEESALKRELREEIGAENINIIRACFSIKELRYGAIENDQVFLQTSLYYLIDTPVLGKQDLTTIETTYGVEPRWVSIEQAVKQNEQVLGDDLHQRKGLKTVLIRENTILNKIKENKLCVDLK